MDRVKASVTLTIELIPITKRAQMLLLAEKYPLQDMNFATSPTRLVRKFSLEFLEGHCSFNLTGHDPSPDLAETFSNKVTSAGQNRQEIDFTRFSCKRLPEKIVRSANCCNDSCESGSAGSSLPLSSIFDRLERTVSFSHRLLFSVV